MNGESLGTRVLGWVFNHIMPWVVLALLAIVIVGLGVSLASVAGTP